MKKKIIIAVAVIVILAAGGTFYLNHKVSSAVKDGKIIKGVSCEGISIGGMTRSEAKDAIESHMKEIHQEKITLYVDDERSSAKIEDLGAFAEADKTVEEAYALGRSGSIFTKYSDVKEKKHKLPVYRKYDKAKFEKNVKKATKKIVSEPRNASVKRKAGKFVVIKEKTGYTLNMNETFANFKKAVEAGKHQFELDVVKKKAKYTSKDMAEIKDVLGTYTTEYGGSPYGRKVNVANGASKINGSIVYPGETLSVYKTVSPFTKENGYALAGSYENGQTVQTYGGGICQVSTTLYNAVIRAELKIVERFPHSMTVHYVPRSADAAIAGTHKDMKFKNTFDTPIYIEGKANGSTITFTVYGKKKDPKRTVEFLSETTQVKESSESTVSDNTLAEGQKVLESYGHTGYSARLWKIVKINGKQVSKKVFNTSTYMSTPTVYRVGTKKAEDKKDDKKDKKKDSKETTAQKSETTTAAQKSTTAAQKSTTAKRSASAKRAIRNAAHGSGTRPCGFRPATPWRAARSRRGNKALRPRRDKRSILSDNKFPKKPPHRGLRPYIHTVAGSPGIRSSRSSQPSRQPEPRFPPAMQTVCPRPPRFWCPALRALQFRHRVRPQGVPNRQTKPHRWLRD